MNLAKLRTKIIGRLKDEDMSMFFCCYMIVSDKETVPRIMLHFLGQPLVIRYLYH